MTVSLVAGVFQPEKPMLLYGNVFEVGTVTYSDESALNALEDTTFDTWSTGANLTVDCGAAVYVDAIGIDAHDLADGPHAVTLQRSTDGTTWVNVWTVTPSDNSAIIGAFPLQHYRYWRVVRAGGNIGIIRVGRRLIIPTGVLSGHVAINHSGIVEVLSNRSDGGHFIGTKTIARGAETTINFGLIDREWFESDAVAFEAHYNWARPFFYAGSLTEFPKDIGFCKRPSRASEMRPSYEEGSLYVPFSIDVEVYVNDP